jgi:hypothetical protein
MTPHQGPFPRYFAKSDEAMQLTGGSSTSATRLPGSGHELLTTMEKMVVLTLKGTSAFLWTTVVARFVQVYNNLDPNALEFRLGWDAVNRFCNFFKVSKHDALELRRFYIERSDLARSRQHRAVMATFSPLLAEKFVWKIHRRWLMSVPCFSLVVERLISTPKSGMEVRVYRTQQPSHATPCIPKLPDFAQHKARRSTASLACCGWRLTRVQW